MHLVRAIRSWRHLPLALAATGAAVLLYSVLYDGDITASEWARIGSILILGTAIWGSHVKRANPQCIREHDYMLGYEQGRRDARREYRRDTSAV